MHQYRITPKQQKQLRALSVKVTSCKLKLTDEQLLKLVAALHIERENNRGNRPLVNLYTSLIRKLTTQQQTKTENIQFMTGDVRLEYTNIDSLKSLEMLIKRAKKLGLINAAGAKTLNASIFPAIDLMTK